MAKPTGTTLVGMATVQRNIQRLAAQFPVAAAIAVNEVAEVTMTRSKELTPVEFGLLKDSGRVADPARPANLAATLAYAKEYALAVHEIPPPPAKSEGGRSARHDVGQWKYLETAVNETAATFAKDVADKIGALTGTR